MPEFKVLHIALGGREFEGARPAERLIEPDPSPQLCRRFRKDLFTTPIHFMADIRLAGFPLIGFQWLALCTTAGLVMLRSGRADPDVFSLLLNGLESEDEMKLI